MNPKSHYLKKIYNWLLPHTCILCNQNAHRLQDLCQACLKDLPSLILACKRCARPLSFQERSLICDECLKNPPPFDHSYALYLYQPPVTKLIMDLKFREALVNAKIWGELLADKIQQDWYQLALLPEAIIPVPLHKNRLKERGFNQALEIARPIAKALHLPIEMALCQRVKATAAQATLPADQRAENIKRAFRITRFTNYRYVAVVDDVMTTGQTITELCLTLKRAGIKQIDVWCCARPGFL